MPQLVLSIFLMIIAAVALAIIDLALGPDDPHFPCAHPLMQFVLKLYAVALFAGAARLLSSLAAATPLTVPWEMVGVLAAMAAAHVVLLALLLRARLPLGVWPRLERRQAQFRTRRPHSL